MIFTLIISTCHIFLTLRLKEIRRNLVLILAVKLREYMNLWIISSRLFAIRTHEPQNAFFLRRDENVCDESYGPASGLFYLLMSKTQCLNWLALWTENLIKYKTYISVFAKFSQLNVWCWRFAQYFFSLFVCFLIDSLQWRVCLCLYRNVRNCTTRLSNQNVGISFISRANFIFWLNVCKVSVMFGLYYGGRWQS